MSTDVTRVQQLLNASLGKLAPGARPLATDGRVGPKTIGAIEDYQRRVLRLPHPDGRVDPNGKTIQSLLNRSTPRPRLIVAVHGWPGKSGTRGFRLCAETVAGAVKGGTSLVRYAPQKQDFIDLIDECASLGDVQEIHMYSHTGMDGPVFSDGQFLPRQLEAGALPRMGWATGAVASFYGCNAGLSPWILSFAVTQKVTVRGSAGFSVFSRRRHEFYPFDGDPDSTPCYLDCFPGMADLLIQRYGYLKPENFLDELWRRAKALPEWMEARLRHLPPRPMRVFQPS